MILAVPCLTQSNFVIWTKISCEVNGSYQNPFWRWALRLFMLLNVKQLIGITNLHIFVNVGHNSWAFENIPECGNKPWKPEQEYWACWFAVLQFMDKGRAWLSDRKKFLKIFIDIPLNPRGIIFSSLGEHGETSEKYLWNPQPDGLSWPSQSCLLVSPSGIRRFWDVLSFCFGEKVPLRGLCMVFYISMINLFTQPPLILSFFLTKSRLCP